MTVRQLLPEGLAEMAPGPQLGAALAGLELRALTGSDLVEVLQARARQLAHEQAQLLAAMAEIGWCDPIIARDGDFDRCRNIGQRRPMNSFSRRKPAAV